MYNDEESDISEWKNEDEDVQRVEQLSDMKAIDCFQVFSRVYSQDFNKFFLKTQVNIPKKFSICRLFNCKPKKEKKSFPITIALDRVVLRHTDTGINIVI